VPNKQDEKQQNGSKEGKHQQKRDAVPARRGGGCVGAVQRSAPRTPSVTDALLPSSISHGRRQQGREDISLNARHATE